MVKDKIINPRNPHLRRIGNKYDLLQISNFQTYKKGKDYEFTFEFANKDILNRVYKLIYFTPKEARAFYTALHVILEGNGIIIPKNLEGDEGEEETEEEEEEGEEEKEKEGEGEGEGEEEEGKEEGKGEKKEEEKGEEKEKEKGGKIEVTKNERKEEGNIEDNNEIKNNNDVNEDKKEEKIKNENIKNEGNQKVNTISTTGESKEIEDNSQ